VAFPTPQAVARMFPDSATIERPTSSFDSEGSQEQTWDVVASDVPAQLSDPSVNVAPESEVRSPEGTFVLREQQLFLLGDVDVQEADRVTIDGHIYDVRSASEHSYREVYTSCRVELRTGEEVA